MFTSSIDPAHENTPRDTDECWRGISTHSHYNSQRAKVNDGWVVNEIVYL